MADDKVLTAPIIVSGAGIFNTYQRMLPEALRKQFDLTELGYQSGTVGRASQSLSRLQ